MQTQIEMARHRLHVLAHDTEHEQGREMRRVTTVEHMALETVLAQLHRMNQVASDQRKEISDLNLAAAKRKK